MDGCKATKKGVPQLQPGSFHWVSLDGWQSKVVDHDTGRIEFRCPEHAFQKPPSVKVW
jgi:hypothetical protein